MHSYCLHLIALCIHKYIWIKMHADVYLIIWQYLLSDNHLSSIVFVARDTVVNKKGVPVPMMLVLWQEGEDTHHHGRGAYMQVGVRLREGRWKHD